MSHTRSGESAKRGVIEDADLTFALPASAWTDSTKSKGVLYLKADPAELALTAGMKEDQEEPECEADLERVAKQATEPGREL